MMTSTPSVLSMGKRVMEDNFSFIWIQGMDPCVITPYGAVVPICVIDGVPYLESNDFRINCRDHFTTCSERCGVIVRDGCVEISVKLDCLGTVACPGIQQPEPLGVLLARKVLGRVRWCR